MNSQTLSWLVLAISVVLETAGTLALKQSTGLTKPGPAALCGLFYICAIWFMGISMRRLDMGVAYAAWAAGSTALTALMGSLLLNEHLTLAKVMGLTLIGAGVALLNLSDAR